MYNHSPISNVIHGEVNLGWQLAPGGVRPQTIVSWFLAFSSGICLCPLRRGVCRGVLQFTR